MPRGSIDDYRLPVREEFATEPFEAWLIVQAVAWYLRYPLSYLDLEEMFRERSFEADHGTVNRWVLAYAPMIEKRLQQFRRPHCGSVRIDETCPSYAVELPNPPTLPA